MTQDTIILTIDEQNAAAEKAAQDALKKSLFSLYNQSREAFVKALQFNERDAVKRFTTRYVVLTDANTTAEAETGIKFTVFNLWNDVNDPKKTTRKAINALVRKVADIAAKRAPSKADAKEAMPYIADIYRLLGFGHIVTTYAERDGGRYAAKVKSILADAHRLTDNGKTDARDSEVKRGLQAVLYSIVCNTPDANARAERAKTKAVEAVASGKHGETKNSVTVETETIDGVTIA